MFELELVVAHHQGRGPQAAGLALVIEQQGQLARRAQQRNQTRPQGHQTAAAILLFVGLAVFEQLRIQAQAGIDQERPAVEQADLNRPGLALQEAMQGRFRVLGDAVTAAEVVERALGQDAERHVLAQHRAGDGVERAVAARGDDDALLVARAPHRGLGRFGQPGRIFHGNQLVAPSGRIEDAADGVLQHLRVAAPRSSIEDDEERFLSCQGPGPCHGALLG
ncbi:hypothetical protein D9M68_692320 [compost metagenome]